MPDRRDQWSGAGSGVLNGFRSVLHPTRCAPRRMYSSAISAGTSRSSPFGARRRTIAPPGPNPSGPDAIAGWGRDASEPSVNARGAALPVGVAPGGISRDPACQGAIGIGARAWPGGGAANLAPAGAAVSRPSVLIAWRPCST